MCQFSAQEVKGQADGRTICRHRVNSFFSCTVVCEEKQFERGHRSVSLIFHHSFTGHSFQHLSLHINHCSVTLGLKMV